MPPPLRFRSGIFKTYKKCKIEVFNLSTKGVAQGSRGSFYARARIEHHSINPDKPSFRTVPSKDPGTTPKSALSAFRCFLWTIHSPMIAPTNAPKSTPTGEKKNPTEVECFEIAACSFQDGAGLPGDVGTINGSGFLSTPAYRQEGGASSRLARR